MNLKATFTFLLALSSFLLAGQNYLMNAALTSVNDCSGFFMDSGGGSNPYGPNQHFTTTICPDGTTGTHIQLIFSGTQIGAGDDLCFFDGNSTAATPLGCASDFNGNAAFIIQATAANNTGCLTITFDSDATDQGSGWSADINCIPACQTIFAVLDQTDPIIEPADTGWIDICPGDRVFFWGKGEYPQNGTLYNHSDLTTDFEWDFGDGAITYGPTVSHVFDEPGGYIVHLKLTDQLGCKNTNYLSQRIRVAHKPDFMIGNFVQQICVGDTVGLNAMIDSMDVNHTVSVNPVEEGFQTLGIRSDSLALPDGNGSSYQTTITFSDFSPGQLLTNINDLLGIWVNMEHSWLRDLEISLTCPNGQSAILHNHPGNIGGEVFLGVPFENDEGLAVPIPGVGWDYGWQVNPDYNYTWITYANAFSPGTLPSGSYKPFQTLNNFLGCPLNGDWTIEVTDLWPVDNGYIFSWSIDFNPDLYPARETFTPAISSWAWNDHPSIFYSELDSITGAPTNAGEVSYVFAVTDEFGCVWDTAVDIRVLPVTHPDCHSCSQLLSPAGDTTVCLGEPVDIDVSMPTQPNLDVTFESYDDYAIGAGNHPPANPYFSTINVNSNIPATITNPAQDIVSICLDLTTDFDADMAIYLRAPNNQLLELSTNNGGGGDNYTQTCFTATAVTPINTGAAPFTGNFLPEGNWNVLNGAPINGNWSLRISDLAGPTKYGKLNWWAITFRATNNVTYTWTPNTGLSCNNCPNPTANPLTSTAYVVTSNDSYGCSVKDTVDIAVLNSFPAPAVTCQLQPGGQVVVNWNDVGPGLEYEVNINGTGWVDPNNGGLSYLVNGVTNGDQVNAEVRVKVNGGACVVGVGNSSCLYQLCMMDAFTSSPGPYAVSCNGACDEAVQISVASGLAPFNFQVTNLTTGNSFAQANGNLASLCPGNYRVIVMDADACADTVSFTVNDQPALMVSASQASPVSCNGDTDGCAMVTASGGVGGFTFVWNDPNASTGANICNLPVGPIMVTATDANGCTATATATITQPPLISLTVSHTDVNCLGGTDGTATVSATGGAGNFTYQWSGGTTPDQATTTGLAANNYSVTVTDGNGCEAFGTVAVSEPSTGVQLTASQTVVSCFGENLSEATATATGGAGGYTYLWAPGNQTTPTAQNLSPGNYTVVVMDAQGCTATADVQIDQWDTLSITLSFAPPSCNGSADGEMAANIVTGGNGVYNFLWSTGDTDDFTNGLVGGQTYMVTVTDGQGCTGTATRFLVDPSAMILTLNTTDALCHGSADGTAVVANVQNAQGPVAYQWGVGAMNQTTATADSLSAGTYNVVVTDTAGCVQTSTVTIGEPTAITAAFQTVNNECFGYKNGSAKIEVTGGTPSYTLAWSTGAANLTSQSSLAAGTYYVSITDANQCLRVDSVIIQEPAIVTAQVTPKDVSCFGERDGAIAIAPSGGTPPFKYSLDGQQYYGSSTLIALIAGDYQLYIKDAKGCIYNASAKINEPAEMTVDILTFGESVDEYMIEYGITLPIEGSPTNAQGDVMYIWDASYCGTLTCDSISDCAETLLCSQLEANPEYSIDYFLTAIDEKGCEAEDHVQIHVKKTRRVMVPTGFSPNQDGLNDLLSIHGKSGTMIKLFQVFDRWGELLFQDVDIPINDTTRGWDGTFKSKDMQSGVYVWYLEAEYEDGMTESFKGETTLIR